MTKFNFIIRTVFLIIFIIFLYACLVYSSNPFQSSKKCSDLFVDCNSADTNDTCTSSCSGKQCPGAGYAHIMEVYINASSFFVGNAIDVTCNFSQTGGTNYEYIWYYNTSNWIKIWNTTNTSSGSFNRSVVFNVNSSEGTHIVRCIYSFGSEVLGECANTTCADNIYDNDDVNFTVTDYLRYTFWNLTNYTTGTQIESGQTYNRNDSLGNITYINVSANWTKTLDKAFIEHNGTGTFVNYSVSITGNWTNYTLDLSDATRFNRINITVRAIYANDSTGIWGFNSTSPSPSFNLDPGLAPSVNSLWLKHMGTNTTNTNLYTNLTIFVNVSDDVGIFAVTANLTYPNNISVILNLTGIPNPVNQTWNYTFNTTGFPLNQTGNYTIGLVLVNDTGDQSANRTFNYNFTVTNNLTLTVSVSDTTPSIDLYPFTLDINISDVNNNLHEHPVNLTITCLNISRVETNFLVTNINGSTSFALCRANNSYSANVNIIINATDQYGNTNSSTFSYTTESAPSGGTTTGGGGGGGGGGVKNITIIQNITANATSNFNFTLQTSEIQIYRGEDSTIVGELSNTGNTNLTITSSIFLNSTCCVISIEPSEFLLEVGGAEIPFTISVHVNISTEPDTEHFVDIKLKSGTLEKSKRIKIIVKENPTISSLNQITGQISEVEEKIREYAKLGLNVGFLQDLLNKIKGTKAESATAMEQDDINRLKQQNNFIQSSLDQINDELNKLAFLKVIYENKWSIFTGITIGIVSTYLVVQIIIPYSKIELEIRKLKLERDSLAKSRVETTKSFFLRKIDDRTFRSILTEGQGKIYKLKSMIDLKNEEKYNLIRTRLNPLYLGKWIKQITKKNYKRREK